MLEEFLKSIARDFTTLELCAIGRAWKSKQFYIPVEIVYNKDSYNYAINKESAINEIKARRLNIYESATLT